MLLGSQVACLLQVSIDIEWKGEVIFAGCGVHQKGVPCMFPTTLQSGKKYNMTSLEMMTLEKNKDLLDIKIVFC